MVVRNNFAFLSKPGSYESSIQGSYQFKLGCNYSELCLGEQIWQIAAVNLVYGQVIREWHKGIAGGIMRDCKLSLHL